MAIIVKYLTYFSFTIHSTNMTNPIQPTYSNKRRYIWITKQLHEFLIISFSPIFTYFNSSKRSS